MVTQRDLLKRLLREAGGIGCFSGDLRRTGIGNPSQRITELRDEGWEISEKPERYPSGRGIGTRWTRVSEPNTGAPSARINTPSPNATGMADGEPPALLPRLDSSLRGAPGQASTSAPRCAIYDDDWDEAA